MGKFLDDLIEKYRLAEADIVGFTSLFFQTVASFCHGPKDQGSERGCGNRYRRGCMRNRRWAWNLSGRLNRSITSFRVPPWSVFPDFVEKQLAGDRTGCDRIDGVFSKSNLTSVSGGGCHDDLPEVSGKPVRLTGEEQNVNANVPLDYLPFLDRFEDTFPDGALKPMLLFETSRWMQLGRKNRLHFLRIERHVDALPVNDAGERSVTDSQSL